MLQKKRDTRDTRDSLFSTLQPQLRALLLLIIIKSRSQLFRLNFAVTPVTPVTPCSDDCVKMKNEK